MSVFPELSAGSRLWRAASLEELLPGLVHGFTGALAGAGGDDFADALRAHLAARWGGAAPQAQLLDQHHSAEIVETAPGPCDGAGLPPRPRADGAIVKAPPALVAVQTADCVPILAVHAGRGEVAALHAGWRGIAAGILPRLLARWNGAGANTAQVRLAFGPSIRACCYEVRADCTAAFAPGDLAGALARREGRMFLELTRVLSNQAAAFGILPERIEILPHCTGCDGQGAHPPRFASFRRDGEPGRPFPFRNAAYIGLLGP